MIVFRVRCAGHTGEFTGGSSQTRCLGVLFRALRAGDGVTFVHMEKHVRGLQIFGGATNRCSPDPLKPNRRTFHENAVGVVLAPIQIKGGSATFGEEARKTEVVRRIGFLFEGVWCTYYSQHTIMGHGWIILLSFPHNTSRVHVRLIRRGGERLHAGLRFDKNRKNQLLRINTVSGVDFGLLNIIEKDCAPAFAG